jgi:hypothetical protein
MENPKQTKLLEPSLCLNCRFVTFLLIRYADGRQAKAIGCTRLDCDNWGEILEDSPISIEEREG